MNSTVDGSPSRKFYLGIAVVAIAAGAAWILWDPNGAQTNDKAWVESVKLESGEVLKVERHVRFREGRALGGGYSTGQVFESSDLRWHDNSNQPISWKAPMRAFYLGRDPDTYEWIVVAGGGSGLGFYEANGSPCPPQWAFRLRRGVWYVQPVPTSMFGRLPNLLFDLRVTDDRRFPYPPFSEEVSERKERFARQPQQEDLGTFVVGAIGQMTHCQNRDPGFTNPFVVNESMPGLNQFPRLP